MKNISHKYFRRCCAMILQSKVVSLEQYLDLVDWYLTISASENSHSRRLSLRWLQLVNLKFRRTSIWAKFPECYPRAALNALRYQDRIANDIAQRSLQQPFPVKCVPTTTHSGRWISSITVGGSIRRFLNGKVTDMFGYRHTSQEQL
jgi:hypothetical protein